MEATAKKRRTTDNTHRLFRAAVRATEKARTHSESLCRSAAVPDHYDGFLPAVNRASTLWAAADKAWRTYDAKLSMLRAIEERWVIDTLKEELAKRTGERRLTGRDDGLEYGIHWFDRGETLDGAVGVVGSMHAEAERAGGLAFWLRVNDRRGLVAAHPAS